MKALHLALSLVRVPRLFISLLFWPMVVGIFIAFAQITLTSAYLGLATETASQYEKRINAESPETLMLRERLFGTSEPFAQLEVCRWEMHDGIEVPPTPECAAERLDIRVRTASPATAKLTDLESHFRGSVRAMHICRDCAFQTAVLIDIDTDPRETHVTSIYGIALLSLVDTARQEQVNSHFISAKALIEELRGIGGTILFSPPGIEKPINLSEATRTMALIFNISLLVVITLWLSLRGHRRVLDYFARNDSLLPLVASCGKRTFYSALWIITLLRVGFFLLMVTPATIIGFATVAPSSTINVFIHDKLEFILWLLALLSSLSSLTIIASIAELKHRSSWISFLYKYIPLAIFSLGTVIWGITLFVEESHAVAVRAVIASFPILGISPVLLSPLISLNSTLLAAHAILASVLVLFVMRRNSRWFAAHLEEI